MTSEPPSPKSPSDKRLANVLRMITRLAVRVVDAQILNQQITDDQIRVLTNAAMMLQDHAISLRPLVLQALHGIGVNRIRSVFADEENQVEQDLHQPREKKAANKLAWLRQVFQRQT